MGIKEKINQAKNYMEEQAKKGLDKAKKLKDEFDAKQTDKKLQKQLESDLEQAFIRQALEYKILTQTEGKVYRRKTYAITDYDKKTLTLYGEVNKLVDSFFVDNQNQKFVIKMIRQKQSIDLQVKDVVYNKTATIIDFEIYNDESTKQEVVKIVNNSIQINDSKIVKSTLGNE